MNILITGGAGYISLHIAVALLDNRHRVFLYDNLSNSNRMAVERMNGYAGQSVIFIEGDIYDTKLLEQVLVDCKIELVLHAAAVKPVYVNHDSPQQWSVGDFQGSFCLLKAMRKAGVRQLIFSSSAAIYGEAQYLPLDEMHPTNPVNDYGRTKLAIERMFAEFATQEPDWRILALRYFNVAGLHDAGLFRQSSSPASRNLVFHLAEVASGKIPFLNVCGDRYLTVDGTFVRDYIHVMDTADAHVSAVNYMEYHQGFMAVNIGSGRSTSVLELIKVFEKSTGMVIPFKIQQASYNDVTASCADSTRARHLLSWQASRTLEDICLSEWRWGGH